jgi:hypothetical protein
MYEMGGRRQKKRYENTEFCFFYFYFQSRIKKDESRGENNVTLKYDEQESL